MGKYIFDPHCSRPHNARDGWNVIEMGGGQFRIHHDIGGNANDGRVLWKHQRLAVRRAMHLDLGVPVRLETLDNQQIHTRHLCEQLGQRRFRCTA